MSSRSTRGTARTLRGVWSRRWTLLPLLVLTVVVVAGTVTVLAFADAAGTSRLLALPLLLLGLVAVPGTARELAGARRGEVALARLRGLQGVSLTALLMAEPLVVLVVGGVLGLLAGLVGAHLAAAVWAGGAGHVGWSPLLAGGAVVLVALAAVTLGMVAALREPLVQQVSPAARPRAASVLAAFGSVLVVVAAVVAAYRSQVTSGAPDWLVLTGPALVGLACGEAVVWLLRVGARVMVPATTGRGLGGFLAARRLARVADAVTAVRVLVAAAVVAGLAATGAQQVGAWTDATARLRAGAPLQIRLDTDATGALDLTRRLDPHGRYLMAAVVVPGTGAVPNRRVFLDTARYDRVVGDFYAGTPAADVGADVGGLAGTRAAGLAVGDTVTATLQGVSPRTGGTLRPRVLLAYRNDRGSPSQLQLTASLAPDGAPVDVSAPLPDCAGGCLVTQLTFLTRRSEPFPWLLSRLQVGGLDAVHLDWQATTPTYPGTPPPGPRVVDDGLLALAPQRYQGDTQVITPAATAADRVPVLATDTARWTDGPEELDSPGGDERPARVVQRFAGLPLVEQDGVLADLASAAVGAPPTVPAAVVMVLARADTPSSVLAGLRPDQRGPARTLADVREATFRQARSAQSRMYGLMAACCLLVALLVLATAVARQRRAWLRDLAALRVVGVAPAALRGAGRREVAGLALAAVLGTAVGTVLCVRLLLGHLPLVDVPAHAIPLHTSLAVAPLVVAAVAAALLVLLVAGRARTLSPSASRPAILREEA